MGTVGLEERAALVRALILSPDEREREKEGNLATRETLDIGYWGQENGVTCLGDSVSSQ